jgi:hypothetical protein
MKNQNKKSSGDKPKVEVREKDLKKFKERIHDKLKAAQNVLSQKSSLTLPELAALFNNIAYTGGGIDHTGYERKQWTEQIDNAVSAQGWQVVWGPAWHYPDIISESDACMFIAKANQEQKMMVVIRGTNPYSLSSWFSQDFDTGIMDSIRDMDPAAPENAKIARGTHKGTQILLNKLPDPKTKKSAGEFLESLSPKPSIIYITGHSLGATITPAYFLYLNYLLNGGNNSATTTLVPISFAGLTPGGVNFNRYFEQKLKSIPYFRFVNSLDIAPFCWWSKQGVLTIYDHEGCGPFYGRPDIIIDELFYGIEGKYEQIKDKFLLSGRCDNSYDLWETEALHQHHVATYLSLIVNNKKLQEKCDELIKLF